MAFLGVVLTVVGCGSDEPAAYLCTPEKPTCPNGQVCDGEKCVPEGSILDQGQPDAGNADKGVTPETDTRPPADGPADQAQPDSLEEDAGADAEAPDVGADAEAPDVGADAEAPDVGADAEAPDSNPPPCGNGTIDTDEECDGTNLDGKSCATFGYTGTGLTCKADCTFDKTACCGDGTVGGSEECDGAALDGNTCATFGYTGTGLACEADCTLDKTACCGDGTIGGSEECDGTAFGSLTCSTQGYDGGTLLCDSSCMLDPSFCEKKNRSLSFDGVDDWVIPPDPVTSPLPDEVTIEAWIKLNYPFPPSSAYPLIYYGGHGGEATVQVDSATDRLLSVVKLINGTHYKAISSVYASSLAGSWHHVAGTWNKATGALRLYIDGVLQTEVTTPLLDLYSPSAPYVPSLGGLLPEPAWFGGKIDEVRVWTVERAAADISAWRSKPLLGNETGLAAYWRFDEGIGLTAADSSTQGSDATLSAPSGPTWSTDVPFICTEAGTCMSPSHVVFGDVTSNAGKLYGVSSAAVDDLGTASWNTCPPGFTFAESDQQANGWWLCIRDDLFASKDFLVGDVTSDASLVWLVAWDSAAGKYTKTSQGSAAWDTCTGATFLNNVKTSNGFWVCEK